MIKEEPLDEADEPVTDVKECTDSSTCKTGVNLVKIESNPHSSSELNTSEKLICLYCNKVLSNRFALTRHHTTHFGSSSAKSHQCGQCEKTFYNATTLEEHTRIHTQETPFACQFCGRKFRRQRSLSEHLRLHNNSTPYFCMECGTTFTRSESLERHMRIHTNVMPYACSHCEKRFKWSTSLAQHTRTHDQEKSNQCSECRKKFSHPSSLDRHMRTIHNSKGHYVCKFCTKTFKCDHSFIRHVKKHCFA